MLNRPAISYDGVVGGIRCAWGYGLCLRGMVKPSAGWDSLPSLGKFGVRAILTRASTRRCEAPVASELGSGLDQSENEDQKDTGETAPCAVLHYKFCEARGFWRASLLPVCRRDRPGATGDPVINGRQFCRGDPTLLGRSVPLGGAGAGRRHRRSPGSQLLRQLLRGAANLESACAGQQRSRGCAAGGVPARRFGCGPEWCGRSATQTNP
jgi:hypothetical protein